LVAPGANTGLGQGSPGRVRQAESFRAEKGYFCERWHPPTIWRFVRPPRLGPHPTQRIAG